MKIWRRIRLSPDARRLAETALEEAARALHAKNVALPESEVEVNRSAATLNVANAVAALVEAAPANAVIDMKTWALVKVTIGESCMANVITLTPAQRAAWDRAPELATDSRNFLSRLTLAVDAYESVARLEQRPQGALESGE